MSEMTFTLVILDNGTAAIKRVVKGVETIGEVGSISFKKMSNAAIQASAALEKVGINIKGMGDVGRSMADQLAKSIQKSVDETALKKLKDLGLAPAASLREASKEATSFHRTLERLQRTALAFIGMWVLTKVLRFPAEVLSTAMEFNSTLEDTQLGIASILVAGGKFKTVTGQTLQGWDQMNAAMALSSELIEQIKVKNLETYATLEQIVKAYQSTLSFGLQKGGGPEQILEYTVAMVQAAGAMRVNLDMMAEELRSLLTGTITPKNTLIATALGITPEDVRKYQGDFTGFLGFVTGKLEAFKFAGILGQKTWTGLVSNVKDAIANALGKGFEPLFEYIKEQLGGIQGYLVKVNEQTNKMEVNPGFVRDLRVISQLMIDLSELFKTVKTIIETTSWPKRFIDETREMIKGKMTEKGEEAARWLWQQMGPKGPADLANEAAAVWEKRQEIEDRRRYFATIKFFPEKKETGLREGQKLLTDIQMKIAEANHEYETQLKLTDDIIENKKKELESQNVINHLADEALRLERNFLKEQILIKGAQREISKASDWSNIRKSLGEILEDYEEIAEAIVEQTNNMIANKLVSKEWNILTDAQLIMYEKLKAQLQGIKTINDGIYKDQMRMVDAQAEYGNLVGNLEPVFVKERMELEKHLQDLKDIYKWTKEYAELKERTQAISEDLRRMEDQKKIIDSLSSAGMEYAETFYKAGEYLDYSIKKLQIQLDLMEKQALLLSAPGGDPEKAASIMLERNLLAATEWYKIDKKILDIKQHIPNLLDEQRMKVAELTGDYQTQVQVLDNQLKRQEDQINLLTEFSPELYKIGEEWKRLLGIQTEIEKRTKALSILSTGMGFRKDLAEMLGGYQEMKSIEIELLEIERQRALMANPQMESVINRLYDLKKIRAEAEKSMDVGGLINIGMSEYAIKSAQDMANAYKNMIPDALKTATDAFGTFFNDVSTGSKTASEAFRSLVVSVLQGIAKMIMNLVMLQIQAQLANIFAPTLRIPAIPYIPLTPGSTGVTPGGNYAEGGSFLTNGLTHLLVGERGRERVDVTPLDKMNKGGGGSPSIIIGTYVDKVEATDTNSFEKKYGDSVKNIMKERARTQISWRG